MFCCSKYSIDKYTNLVRHAEFLQFGKTHMSSANVSISMLALSVANVLLVWVDLHGSSSNKEDIDYFVGFFVWINVG